jgi:hypothetical protein
MTRKWFVVSSNHFRKRGMLFMSLLTDQRLIMQNSMPCVLLRQTGQEEERERALWVAIRLDGIT